MTNKTFFGLLFFTTEFARICKEIWKMQRLNVIDNIGLIVGTRVTTDLTLVHR